MNRIVVRLLTAFLAVIAVTALSQLGVIMFIALVVARGIPEASLQKVFAVVAAALKTVNVGFTTEENYILVALLFGSVIVAVLLAVLLARRIAGPLEAVSQAANRVAQGEWSARAPLHPREARGGSEMARLVRHFNGMAENLEGLESERRATVAAIAHELRTPLTVLRGRLEAVRDGVLEATPDEFTVLISQVELLSRLVTDLRTLSLAEARQLSLERQEIDLATLVRGVVAGFATRAAEKGVRLEVNANLQMRLSLDSERIHQVIGNLIENALRHTSEGFVRVSLEGTSELAVLRVRDSGSGIPTEALPHIFERFYRAESSRARILGGSGLGLAVVKAIVSLHSGEVSARNHPDGGAEFTVTLPIRAGVLAISQPTKKQRPEKQGSLPRKQQVSLQPLEPIAGDGMIAPGGFTAAIYHALSFPLGLLYFVVMIVCLSVSIATSIVGVGLVLLLLSFMFIGYAANLERWLNDALLGVPIASPQRTLKGGFFARLTATLRDPMMWRAVIYLIVKFPFSLLSSVGLLILGALSLALIAAPILQILSPRNHVVLMPMSWNVDTPAEAFFAALLGLFLAVFTTLLSSGLAWIWARFARLMLSDHHATPQPVNARRLEV